MPEIGHIEQQEFTLPVNVLGNWLLVTYRPFGITMDMSIQQLASQQQANMNGLYDAFCSTVTTWDLYEDDKQNMVSITPQRLSELPSTLVMLVLEACMDDKSERQEQIVNKGKSVTISHALAVRINDHLNGSTVNNDNELLVKLADEFDQLMEA